MIAKIDIAVQSNPGDTRISNLVARLSARNINRFFSLCHYFAIMKPVAENESRPRQHERVQARAGGYSETARGKHHTEQAVTTLRLNGRLLWVPKELMITAETMSVGSDQIGYPNFHLFNVGVHSEIPSYSIAILQVLLAIMLP